jgi:hypothetical protein
LPAWPQLLFEQAQLPLERLQQVRAWALQSLPLVPFSLAPLPPLPALLWLELAWLELPWLELPWLELPWLELALLGLCLPRLPSLSVLPWLNVKSFLRSSVHRLRQRFIYSSLLVEGKNLQFHCEVYFSNLDVLRHHENGWCKIENASNSRIDKSIAYILSGFCRRGDNSNVRGALADNLFQIAHCADGQYLVANRD